MARTSPIGGHGGPPLPRRPRVNLRRPGHDYSAAGAYFVTICTHARQPLFGRVVGVEAVLNDAGSMVHGVLNALGEHVPGIRVEAFAVMPDHIHVVIGIGADVATEPDGTDCRGISNRRPQRAASTDLSVVVRRFKTFVAHRYAVGVAELGWPRYHGHVWQRGYFDRIVRDEVAAMAIRQYVLANPSGRADAIRRGGAPSPPIGDGFTSR